MSSILRYVSARLALGVGTLLAVSVLVFFIGDALPGDAATVALGRDATPERVERLRQQFELDRPMHQRYGEWLSGLPRGRLGHSLPSGTPVEDLLGDRIRNTVVVSGLTLALLVPLSILFGVWSAVRKDRRFDHAVGGSTLALIATPEFVVGSFLILLLARWLGWLPPVSLVSSGRPLFAQLSLLVLPVLTLLAASVAQTIRMVRATMIDVLDLEFIEMCRLRGVPERRVLFRHALPNALGPVIQIIAINVAWLVGGVVVVEAVFQFPGLGSALAGAVSSRDLPTVMAIVMLLTTVYVLANLIADLAVSLLNPRLRRAE